LELLLAGALASFVGNHTFGEALEQSISIGLWVIWSKEIVAVTAGQEHQWRVAKFCGLSQERRLALADELDHG
tara:strand:- start:424 stop:642 length:219 start_codon:yes stop_codon:yes gene_type:complete